MTPESDSHHLQIRCPSCSQRFKVGSELMGKTVECGACESRFEIEEEVIVRNQKFYPGERDPSALNRFQRVPLTTNPGIKFTPAGGPQFEKGYISPITRVSRLRIALGWLGALLILGATYVLASRLPVFIGLSGAVRGLIAVGAGVVGLALIAFANPRTRGRTLAIATVFTLIFLGTPFLLFQKILPPPNEAKHTVERTHEIIPEGKASDDTLEGLRAKIGIEPLEEEIRKLSTGNQRTHAYGVWLRDLSGSDKLAVRDYLVRALKADPTSPIYQRDGRDYLMVLTGVEKPIAEVAEVTKRFARKQVIHQELDVIETEVESRFFMEGPLEKLTDKTSPAFYDLNKRELESIQLDRVQRAVKRLTGAEPNIYREDITRLLIGLLTVPEVDFPGEISAALLVWAEDPATAGDAAAYRLKLMSEVKKQIPQDLVRLLSKGKNVDALPYVRSLWMNDVTRWEPHYSDFGPVAEASVLEVFPNLEGTVLRSAARVLEKVGGKDSIPVLEKARAASNDPELHVQIDSAIKVIKSRL